MEQRPHQPCGHGERTIPASPAMTTAPHRSHARRPKSVDRKQARPAATPKGAPETRGKTDKPTLNGAEFLVKALEAHGVTHVFGIPGAKVDSVFTALLDSPIQVVLCRHEQNAAFMAQAFGRLTGRIGVCLATSGPGVTNLVTGLATATTEGDPACDRRGGAPRRSFQTHPPITGCHQPDAAGHPVRTVSALRA